MNVFRYAIFFFAISLFGLTACGVDTPPEAIATGAFTSTAVAISVIKEATVEPITPTPRPTFTSTPSPEPTATNTPEPTLMPTLSPTRTPKPKAKINGDLTTPINVRKGPGTNYPVVGRIEPGEETNLTGRNEDSSWWQVTLADGKSVDAVGWVFGELVTIENGQDIPLVEAPPTPVPPTPTPETAEATTEENSNAETLAEQLRCGKDFCVTYQAMVPMAENGGCVGNHSIYITVLQGPPPGVPMDGVIIGDTYNNVDMMSGSHGPGTTEITLWMNSMTLIAKRNADGTPYTSEESFNFTSHDELIPVDVLAANGYCGGSVEQCRLDQQHNGICRGHYSWRVTFHKFD